MLQIITESRNLDFFLLTKVYQQSNDEKASQMNHKLSNNERALLVQQDFIDYMHAFFCQSGSFVAVWVEDGEYCAAARVEPFEDGFLLNGLETSPDYRNRGIGTNLLQSIVSYVQEKNLKPLYSHVSKSNHPSLRVHDKCGFVRIKDCARYIDGSVYWSSCTLCYK